MALTEVAPEPYVGEVRGVRRFHPTKDGLGALFSRWSVISPGPNKADCRTLGGRVLHHRKGETSPAEKCDCGFYAYYWDDYDHYAPIFGTMQGVVEAWGKVVTGNNGFRAEYMRLVALVRRSSEPPPRFTTMGDTRLPGEGIPTSVAVGLGAGLVLVLVLSGILVMDPMIALAIIALSGVTGWFLLEKPAWRRTVETRQADQSMAERYGVPLYETLDDAQRDFPVTGRPDDPPRPR